MDAITLINMFVVILSTIASTAALWVAWDCRAKTTQHFVDIIGSSTIHTKTADRSFGEFSIAIKNQGLPIPEMAVSLTFQEKDGLGRLTCPLSSIDIVTGESARIANNVLCGLVVKFGFLSDKMSQGDKQFLARLVDFREQDAAIRVYCGGYQVESFQLYCWSQRLNGFRNSALFTISKTLSIGNYAKDQKSWRARLVFRKSPSLMFALGNFLKAIRVETKSP